MSKIFYKPVSKSPLYIRPATVNHTKNAGTSVKSRSYLAKLREKQEQLIRENSASVNLATKSEEVTEKSFAYCDRSITRSEASWEKNPQILVREDEEILNIIRIDQPKAELKSSPKPNYYKYPSPMKAYVPSEKCEEVERELKNQRTRYRRLESQYKDLLNKNTHVEVFYKGIIENINTEILKSDDKAEDPMLVALNCQIYELRSNFLEIEKKSALIEEKIRSKL